MMRTTCLFSLVMTLCSSSAVIAVPPTPQKAAASAKPAAPQAIGVPSKNAPLSVAVLPFRNPLDDADTASLAAGFADSLSASFRNLSGISVADPLAVMKAADGAGQTGDEVTEEDAVKLCRTLGVRALVTGSYQRMGDQMRVEARVLDASTGVALPGGSARLDGSYPNGYFDMLDQLAARVAGILRVPAATAGPQSAGPPATPAVPMDAYQIYTQGLKTMRPGTREALTQAIVLFQSALEKAPDFPQALDRLGEAERLLANLEDLAGENSTATRGSAEKHAAAATSKQPERGTGYTTLSNIYSDAREYDKAEEAALRGLDAMPSDPVAGLALGRARGRGGLARSPELDRALRTSPWLSSDSPVLPKVRVENQGQYDIRVRFLLPNGDSYSEVAVDAGSSRVVALPPGPYRVNVTSTLGSRSEQYTLEAGTDYALTYKDWPVTILRVVNGTSYPLKLGVGNAVSTVVSAKQTQTLRLQPGTYSYRANAGPASLSGKTTLDAGVYNWKFDPVNIRATVHVVNNTDGVLSVTVGDRAVRVGVGNSKPIVLHPGTYKYKATSQGVSIGGSRKFDAGASRWTFSRGSIPSPATVAVNNRGSVLVSVRLTGPANYSVSVGGHSTKQIKVAPGTYRVTARAGGASLSRSMTVESGGHEELIYEVVPVYR